MRGWWTRLGVTVTAVAGLGLILASGAEAAQRTWTGTNSGSWSDPANWGGTAPVPGDALVFPDGAANTTNTNDFAPGTAFASISSSGFYTLGGNPIVLGAGGLTVTRNTTVALQITLGADQTWANSNLSAWIVTQAVHLNGSTLTFGASFAANTLSGAIDGVGAIVCDGGQVILSGGNSYQGPTTIRNFGSLLPTTNTALGLGDGTLANGTVVMAGSTLNVDGLNIGNEALSLSGDGRTGGGALRANVSASWAGPITLAGDTTIVPNADAATLTLSGVISGPGRLTAFSLGTLVLANTNTFTGGLVIPGFSPHGTTVELAADEAVPGAPAININNGTLRINGHRQTLSGLTGAGTLDLPTAASVLKFQNTADAAFAGRITGASGVLQHTGTGNLTLSGASTFTGDLLADAVFEDLEILFLQVRDELTVPVEHRGVDLHVVDGHLEGDGRLVGRCGRRLLGRERGYGRERNHRSTDETAHEHDGVIPSVHWQP